MDLTHVGKWLIGLGIAFAAFGAILVVSGRFTGGRPLPGDISLHRGGIIFYLPITTCLLVIIILSLLLSVIVRKH